MTTALRVAALAFGLLALVAGGLQLWAYVASGGVRHLIVGIFAVAVGVSVFVAVVLRGTRPPAVSALPRRRWPRRRITRAGPAGQVVDLQVGGVQHQRRQDDERDVLGDELEPEPEGALADVAESGPTSEMK